MNKQESDILNVLLIEPFINQRILAEVSGHSLGVVNRSLKELIKLEYIDDSIRPTVKAITEFKQKTPQRAVILAAGFGMRMVPINTEMPKGLLEVNGEALIERIIKQLHEVGIKEIYVVVGFMKEKYEYLIDEYGVELVVNADYAAKNNLHSVKLVKNTWRMLTLFLVTFGVTEIHFIAMNCTLGTWSVILWTTRAMFELTVRWNW